MAYNFSRQFRVTSSTFLSLLYFVFAVGIWGAAENKFGISADVPNTPGTITVNSVSDFEKAVAAGDGNLIVKDNKIQLKGNAEFTDWVQKANIPALPSFPSETIKDGRVTISANDINTMAKSYIALTPSLTYDPTNNRFILQQGPVTNAFDSSKNTWSEVMKLQKIMQLQSVIASDRGDPHINGWWVDSLKKILLTTRCNDAPSAAFSDGRALNSPSEAGIGMTLITPPNTTTCEKFGDNTQGADGSQAEYYDPTTEKVFRINGVDPKSLHFTSIGTFSASGGTGGSIVITVDEAKTGKRQSFNVAGGPDKRLGATIAFDSNRNELYVFGGFRVGTDTTQIRAALGNIIPQGFANPVNVPAQSVSFLTFEPLAEVWAFDFKTSTWSERDPQNTPAGRGFAQSVYDTKNKRFVMFGGLTQRRNFGFHATHIPGEFSGFLPGSNVPVLDLGAGQASYVMSDETWSYDPEKNNFAKINTKTKPGARYGENLAYDPENHEILLTQGYASAPITTPVGPLGVPEDKQPPRSSEAWLLEANGVSAGTCQFDVGGALISKITNFTSIKTTDIPAAATVSVQFAGSPEGVSFGAFSAPVTLNKAKGTADVIDLTKLIPTGSRFVRVKCSLSSTDVNQIPNFEGFTLGFEALGTQTVATATPTATSTPGATPTATQGTNNTPTPTVSLAAARPAGGQAPPQGLKLVATGGSLLFNLLIALLLSLLTTVFFLRRRHDEGQLPPS